MRVAWFANIDFQEGNAANSRIRAFAKGLKANHAKVFLFFLSPTIFNSNGINKKSKGFYDGIYFNYLSGTCYRSQYLLIRFLRYVFAILNSSFLLIRKRNHFDVIFLYSPRLLFFGHIYLLGKILKIPVVIEKTELDQAARPKKILHRFLSLFDKLEPYVLKYFCTHLIVISDNLKKYYQKYLPENKISKIPIIVDLTRFDVDHNPDKKFSVGYLGSFAEKDGINGLISSFKKALQIRPELKLKLIGFNPNKKQLNLNLKSLQLNGAVQKSGQITYEQVPHWLGQCDLLVMNRTNDPYSHYGFPTKLGEYLATGIPTICTRVGDIESYLTDRENTVLVSPDNQDELTHAILERYANYDVYKEIGIKGKQIAMEKFNFKTFVPVLYQILFKATQKSGS